jgi:large subunit ribosomal protein L30
MDSVKVTLKRSIIGQLPKHRRTVKALGLGRVGSVVVQKATPDIMGMVRAVSHLLEVETVAGGAKEKK